MSGTVNNVDNAQSLSLAGRVCVGLSGLSWSWWLKSPSLVQPPGCRCAISRHPLLYGPPSASCNAASHWSFFWDCIWILEIYWILISYNYILFYPIPSLYLAPCMYKYQIHWPYIIKLHRKGGWDLGKGRRLRCNPSPMLIGASPSRPALDVQRIHATPFGSSLSRHQMKSFFWDQHRWAPCLTRCPEPTHSAVSITSGKYIIRNERGGKKREKKRKKIKSSAKKTLENNIPAQYWEKKGSKRRIRKFIYPAGHRSHGLTLIVEYHIYTVLD